MPDSTLVFQSHRPDALEGWIGRCTESVRQWAEGEGHDYSFIGDEFFETVDPGLREKLAHRLPVLADLARLYAARAALERYERVVWFDADTLLFAPSELSVDIPDTFALGEETWIEEDGNGRLKPRRNLHNAVLVIRRGDPVLPFLIRCTERILSKIDPDRIAPQIVGPKLMSALNPMADFTVLKSVGALSPLVIRDIAAGRGNALSLFRRRSSFPLAGANLCASLVGADAPAIPVEKAIDRMADALGG